MKKLTFSLLFFMASLAGFAQIPVTDAASAALIQEIAMQDNMYQMTNYAEFAQQSATMATTLKQIRKMRDRLKDINGIVSQVMYYKRIINLNLRIISYEIDYIAAIKDNKNLTTHEISIAIDMFGDILRRSENLFKLATDIITPNKLKMTDSERLHQLRLILNEMSDLFTEMTILNNKLEYLCKDRALQNILKGW